MSVSDFIIRIVTCLLAEGEPLSACITGPKPSCSCHRQGLVDDEQPAGAWCRLRTDRAAAFFSSASPPRGLWQLRRSHRHPAIVRSCDGIGLSRWLFGSTSPGVRLSSVTRRRPAPCATMQKSCCIVSSPSHDIGERMGLFFHGPLADAAASGLPDGKGRILPHRQRRSDDVEQVPYDPPDLRPAAAASLQRSRVAATSAHHRALVEKI